MCGIAGIVLLEKSLDPDSASQMIEAMVDSMEHRGPDSRGVRAQGHSCLGACRLAILGLETASNQPFTSPDSMCTIVFNGEIYNYIELRDELRQLGHTFVSTGDTEVIVHAYEAWGPECVRRFNGMFAFVISDEESRSTFFARDRFGVKPIYYVKTASLFAFASEPLPLLECGLVRPDLDEHSLIDYLKFGVTDTADRTFFRDIRQVRPGHCGVIRDGSVAIEEWYDITGSVSQPGAVYSSESATASFRELFESSVRLRLRSDVPVGVLLSGGLDSSSIVSMSSRVASPSSLTAFSVSFPGSVLDESAYAKAAAARCSVPLVFERARTADLEAILGCVRDQQEPVISPSVVAQWLVMKAVSQSGFRVLLSGQGSDEYLGGYEYFDAYAVMDAIASGHLGLALRHIFHERSSRRVVQMVLQTLFLAFPSKLKSKVWRKPWLHEEGHSLEHCDYYRAFARCRSLKDALLFHVKMRLPELLRYEDRNSMAFSVETRHPFLDYRLVMFGIRTPGNMLVGNGVRKRILSLALQDIIAPEILNRRDKVGFQTPPQWLDSGEFRSSFLILIQKADGVVRKFIDVDQAKALLEDHASRQNQNDLWRVYNFMVWYDGVTSRLGQPPSGMHQ